MMYLVGVFFHAVSGVAGVPFAGISLDLGFVLLEVSLLSEVSFVGVLSVSVGVSLLRCSGVGVSGVAIGKISLASLSREH
jgi:hypothetical protein